MTFAPAERIRCLEVWGGNVRIEKQVEVPGLDVWLASRPLGDDEAGGDVYYISSCAAGRLARILLADVSGHGEQVAHIADRLRDLMRKNIEVADHRRFVAHMNRQFEEGGQSESFATAVVFSFFAPTKSLVLCNAGHPTPLIRYRSKGRWEQLDRVTVDDGARRPHPAGLPLGILPQTEYHERKVRLARGDAVLCFTDAFTEAQRSDGTPLGVDGLLELVASTALPDDGAELLSRLIDTIGAMHPDNLRQDDATLVLFQATGVRFRLRDQLTAPLRHLFSSVLDFCRIAAPRQPPQLGPRTNAGDRS